MKVAQLCLTLLLQELYSPWNSPGQNTGVGSLFLLQGIFPTQGLNLRSPALQVDSLPAEPQGKPLAREEKRQIGIFYKAKLLGTL